MTIWTGRPTAIKMDYDGNVSHTVVFSILPQRPTAHIYPIQASERPPQLVLRVYLSYNPMATCWTGSPSMSFTWSQGGVSVAVPSVSGDGTATHHSLRLVRAMLRFCACLPSMLAWSRSSCSFWGSRGIWAPFRIMMACSCSVPRLRLPM